MHLLTKGISRRNALLKTGLVLGTSVAGKSWLSNTARGETAGDRVGRPFLFCMNTATLRGQKLGIVKEIEVTAQAGYDAIEPWVDSIQAYVQSGGKLNDLRNRITDLGLTVEGAIAFPQWIVEDGTRRAQALEQAKREMELVAQIGGKRIAAPPSGATDLPKLEPLKIAERYRALLEAGHPIGVLAQLELWGHSQNLSRLGECAGAAIETGDPTACVLIDVFHLYKGGSGIHGLALLGTSAVHVLHVNDYPAEPPRERITDSYRVFPGDGVAPFTDILQTLHNTGGQKVLSLELFNREYWSEEPLTVARAGLAKMKKAVETVHV
jgi:2-keto-myo-inositol isomerase